MSEHIGEVREDVVEASIPRTSVDPTLLTSYLTHVDAFI